MVEICGQWLSESESEAEDMANPLQLPLVYDYSFSMYENSTYLTITVERRVCLVSLLPCLFLPYVQL